ncbi:hypothetical protein CEUSTIGMA_g6033.t1 [Chlamydomonas eustigma]|uniref:Protein kinase domain-containing protein n=1 Tax=Chlamydomonas eustigma TaxID=1157962 RepID=A0A250X686_9CHLO|nr:hypothetical protein CEUSTIGMA_g6033.t1 [Chlamydomonas eustigma]|eukprot:GAX78594.1 hypothetical protein CEUSTIGMA_g6033.t1 [Chlamydomonas eustigma]
MGVTISSNKGTLVTAPSVDIVKEKTSSIHNDEGAYLGTYSVIKLLGAGTEGEAYLVEDDDGKKWALKVVRLPLPKRMVQAMIREIQLQSELGEGHVNIISAEELVLTSHYIGLVIEWAPGGSLTDLITNKFNECQGVGLLMPEHEVRYLFRQIVNAVEYMHRHHVAHRDLKLDNTLLTPPYPPYNKNPPYIKLCDFGFAREWNQTAQFSTVIGTPDYMAPQVLEASGKKRQYDGAKADVWAMGVLLCVMMIGKFPFEGDTVSTTSIPDPLKQIWLQQHKKQWYDNALLQDQLKYMSPEVRDLLDKMFEVNESKRLDVKDIKTHPWMMKKMPPDLEAASVKMEREQVDVARKVEAGHFNCKLRDAAVQELIENSSSPEFREQSSKSGAPTTKFEILSRIKLRTVMEAYPKFDKMSVHAMLKPKRPMRGR